MLKNNKVHRDNGEIFNIPPYLIKPNPSLARTDFPDTSLVSLADSIRRYGMLQPLAVRLSDKGRYELIAGERRLRAAILLELPTVPCVLLEDCGNFEYLSVVENIQREKLNMFDEARAVRRLFERSGRDMQKTCGLLSIGEGELSRKLRLCEYSRAEMQAIQRLGISEREAEIFLCVPHSLRYYTIKLCSEKRYSVSDILRLCKELAKNTNLTPDDLESFADNFFKTKNLKVQDKCCENGEKTEEISRGKTKVVLKSLRVFENSLRRNCTILENAGYDTDIEALQDENKTTYTITIRIR